MVYDRIHPGEEPIERDVSDGEPARRRRQIQLSCRTGEQDRSAAEPCEGLLDDRV
jgi:hypothetical protein